MKTKENFIKLRDLLLDYTNYVSKLEDYDNETIMDIWDENKLNSDNEIVMKLRDYIKKYVELKKIILSSEQDRKKQSELVEQLHSFYYTCWVNKIEHLRFLDRPLKSLALDIVTNEIDMLATLFCFSKDIFEDNINCSFSLYLFTLDLGKKIEDIMRQL